MKQQEFYVIGMGGGSRSAPEPELVLIDREAGTNIGNMSIRLDNAFDGITTQVALSSTSLGNTNDAWVGKTLAAPKIFGEAVVHGSSDRGYIDTVNPEITLRIYGKQGAAPSSSSDGTLLGTLVFTDTDNESVGRTVESTDLETEWDHLWVRITGDETLQAYRCAELVLYEWA